MPDAVTSGRIVAGAPRYAFLSVSIDEVALRELQARIAGIPNGLARILPPALNKAASEARTLFYKEFSLRMNIARKASIKSRLELKPRASRGSWAAGVRIALTRFTVASFKGTRQLKAGVRWSPEPGREQLIPRAFIQKGLTHYQSAQYMDIRQVWRRKRAGDGEKLVPRYPIQILRGPSLAKVFSDDLSFQSAMDVQGGRILEKKLDQQVDRLVAQVAR